jgi:protein TonB
VRGLLALAAPLFAFRAAAADIDVTAGSGEPDALDSICEIDRARRGDREVVGVICPLSGRPSERTVRASVEQGFGERLFPVPANPSARTNDGRWIYVFAVDDGRTPYRVEPSFPIAAARNGYVATCALRFDLTPDGSTTNLCVSCEATGARREFESSVREAASRWIYPQASGDPAAPERASIRIEMPFERHDPGHEPIHAPPVPASACPVGEG